MFVRLTSDDRAVTSVQCLSEFYRVVTRRLPEPMDPEHAVAEVGRLIDVCPVLDLTGLIVLEACRGSAQHRMGLWDALVWATAKLNQVRYVVTEDAEHGSSVEGVTFLNLFDARFDLAALTA